MKSATLWRYGPLHAAIEEFASDGYTHVECFCPGCRDKTETDQLAQLVLWLANLNVHIFLGNFP